MACSSSQSACVGVGIVSMNEQLLVHARTIDRFGVEHADQALVISNGRIQWCGAMEDLPAQYTADHPTIKIDDCKGRLLTPGFIDCHTHLVYAGNRADEFKQRLEGLSYADIAKRGGGILYTVQQTRAASFDELLEQSLPRIVAMRAEGVSTVEIKSGYGLDLASEMKMLRVARKLALISGIRVKTTFLGAHAIPPEYQHQTQRYVDYLCADVLPALLNEGLVDAVDVFCERMAFSCAQMEQIFAAANALDVGLKCHAEQLSYTGGSIVAAGWGALSCDHLEYLDDQGARAMASANTVGVILPGAYYFLRETKKPPIELLRQAGVGIALATDCNPGSSPTTSLRLMMNMACQFFALTVPEALSAVTYQAARALGLADELGAIEPGMKADLLRWSVNDSAELCYYMGSPLPHQMMIAGEWVS